MRNKYRAFVKDEGGAGRMIDRYFIYVESKYGNGAVGGMLRYSRRDVADSIAASINRSFEREGKLWILSEEDAA